MKGGRGKCIVSRQTMWGVGVDMLVDGGFEWSGESYGGRIRGEEGGRGRGRGKLRVLRV